MKVVVDSKISGRIDKIACGSHHSIYVTDKNEIYGTGMN